MFGKTAKKAKLLSDYVKIVSEKLLPKSLKKVATNLTAKFVSRAV